MDLKQIGEELRRLTALAEGWRSVEELPVLERDLALEKLRALYDALLFAGAARADAAAEAPAVDSAPVAVPVDLGLDELLPLVSEAESAPAGDSAVSNPSEERPVETSAPALSERKSASEPQAESVADLEPIAVEPIEPEPNTASEPSAGPEPLPASQAEPTESEPVSEPEPEPEPEAEPEAVAAAESAPAPQPMVGSLFGFEEQESLRHRRKQRVIMSLYDAGEPAKTPVQEKPAVRDAAHPAEKAVAEPPAAQTVPAAATAPAGRPAAEPIPEPDVQTAAAPHPAPAAESPEAVRPKEDASVEEPDLQQIVLSPGSVLGEVINHDVQTLSDTIEVPRDMASELKRREPVTDLERAIGINDKFLMIRDLFNGDAAAYEAALHTLNGFADLDDCMIHIAEHYAWNPNSDGAKLMMELLERKYA